MTYTPPAELVERVALAYATASDNEWGRASETTKEYFRERARLCLAASGLGEAVGMVRKLLALADDPIPDYGEHYKSAEERFAEARALLARLDPQG